MSRVIGEVWSLAGGALGFFVYCGTVDIAATKIFTDQDSAINEIRGNPYQKCACGKKGSMVILFSPYGYGFCWLGRACLDCMAITEGLSPEGSLRGHPFRKEAE